MPERTVIPFGPQHPVLPEPFQLRLTLEEERVVEAVPTFGYVHRGLEQLIEKRDFHQMVYVVERVCGICTFMHALTYCQGIEALMGITVPPRARYLRTIWSELQRLHSHHLWLGLLADSLGYESLFMEAWRIRERVMDITEATAGSRIIISTCQVGGVRRDIGPELQGELRRTLDQVESDLKHLEPVFLTDATLRARTVGKAVLSREDAVEWGASGPMLRASGVPQDMRVTGYAAYGELDFAPITESAGDTFARISVRLKDIHQSIALIREALAKLPDGDISVPVKGNPDGEIVSRAEQPRGEVLYYLKANGTKNLERLRIRTPTFANLAPTLRLLPGLNLADVPMVMVSMDPCISCTER
jgi:Ni,Fe-hydrogenase III large subunit